MLERRPILLGLPFENGIRMMQRLQRGVTGAIDAPTAVLAGCEHLGLEQRWLPLEEYAFEVTLANRDDPQVVAAHNGLTLAGHAAVEEAVAQLVAEGRLPLSIGGDHSLTYPLVRGVSRGWGQERPLGLIVLDAHFDQRPLESHAGVSGLISSGNAFRRLLEDPSVALLGSNLVMLGIHPSLTPIFRAMAGFAAEHQVTAIAERKLRQLPPDETISMAVERATRGTEGVYLSLDIDVVNRLDAPGVSAPNSGGLSRGLWLELVAGLVDAIPNLVGVDIVEGSSRRGRWEALWEEIPTPEPGEADVLTPTVELIVETVEKIAELLNG